MNPLAVAGTADTHPSVRRFTSLRANKQPHRYTKSIQKHPKAWEQNRCYSRYMLFLDTTRYSQLQPGSMQHPFVIPQSKSRSGGTTSCRLVLPTTSGRTARKSRISAKRLRVFLLCGLHLDFRRFLWRCLENWQHKCQKRHLDQETPALPPGSYVIFWETKPPNFKRITIHHGMQTSCERAGLA